MNDSPPSIYPLGDTAMTIDLGNTIDEQLNARALAISDRLKADRFPGLIDILVAYSSVTCFFDPSVPFDRQAVSEGLLEAWRRTAAARPAEAGPLVRIPVCYEGEYAPDLEGVARQTGLSPAELIGIHTATPYRIYMIGFLPGFPYMGKLDPRIQVPRKARPLPVIAGGVGIAGLQTGIYPLNSPGGWQIIGRTSLRLFDRDSAAPVLLHTGDQVQFYPIPAGEFLVAR